MPLPERFELEDILEDPQLRLVIEGNPGEVPTFLVEIQLGPDWIARHQIVPERGVWMVCAAHEYVARHDQPAALTVRLKRKATIHPHLPRIQRLLDEAMEHDLALDLKTPWWERLVADWRISKLRSPRGRTAKINPREVEQLVDEGLSYRQIGDLLGVHRKSVDRAMRRDRKRSL